METSEAVTPEAPSAEPTFTEVEAGDSMCSAMASELPLATQVGQLYMVGVSTTGLDQATRDAIVAGEVGSVVLLGNTDAGAHPIRGITDELVALDVQVPVAIAVDQEGGSVQRLGGEGFSQIPSAVNQAKLAEGELELAARDWADELADAGVHWNLAPVADVVPVEKQSTNQPIGRLERNYGNDLALTSRSVTEFVEGMRIAGIATSLKHFPGLGHVVENTDFDAATDVDVVPGDQEWQSFVAGMDAGASSVMISSAIFQNLDPEQEGVFSSTIITSILRGELGFEGVVIADDLGAAVAVSDIPPADRGVRFIEAGGDVVINANPALMEEMLAATLSLAQEDPDFAEQVMASATRVLDLKSWLGLVECGA